MRDIVKSNEALWLTKDIAADNGIDKQNKTFDAVMSVKMLEAEGEFEGYASTFGNVDQGGDIVVRGAFKKSLRKIKKEKRLIPMLWQHDQREPIGVYKSIVEDENGLKVHGQINLAAGALERRAYEHLKAGALGGMSIGYRMLPGTYEYDADERVTLLKQIDLREISLVTMPMNIEARVGDVKADLEEIRGRLSKGEPLTSREWEKLMQDEFGLSKSQAMIAVKVNSLGKDGLRESGTEKQTGDFYSHLKNALTK